MKQRESFARAELAKHAKEMAIYQNKVTQLQHNLDGFIEDHLNLKQRSTTMHAELDRLKLLYKNNQSYLFQTKKQQEKALGIQWSANGQGGGDGGVRGSGALNSAAPTLRKQMSLSRRQPARQVTRPTPTDTDGIEAILSELSGRGRMLDSLRNSLVCMNCFQLAHGCVVEWKSGELLCSHCCVEKGYVVGTGKVAVKENRTVRGGGVGTGSALRDKDMEESGGEESEDSSGGEVSSGGEGEEEEEEHGETEVPLKDVLQHPKLRALEMMFKAKKMYRGAASSVSIGSRKKTGSNSLGVVGGGPLEKVRGLSRVLREGFVDLKPMVKEEKEEKEKAMNREKHQEEEKTKETAMHREKEIIVAAAVAAAAGNGRTVVMSREGRGGARGTPVNGW